PDARSSCPNAGLRHHRDSSRATVTGLAAGCSGPATCLRARQRAPSRRQARQHLAHLTIRRPTRSDEYGGTRAMHRKTQWLLRCTAAVAALVTVSACSGGSGGSGGTSGAGSGIIVTAAGEAVGMTRVFNPYLPTSAWGLAGNSVAGGNSSGFVYEPLVQVDYVRANYLLPWLAKSWAWADRNKTPTVQPPAGVTLGHRK